MAHIDSESLARKFAAECLPILQARYGDETTLTVIDCEETKRNWLVKRIEKDSEVIRKRLSTRNFASNKVP